MAGAVTYEVRLLVAQAIRQAMELGKSFAGLQQAAVKMGGGVEKAEGAIANLAKSFASTVRRAWEAQNQFLKTGNAAEAMAGKFARAQHAVGRGLYAAESLARGRPSHYSMGPLGWGGMALFGGYAAVHTVDKMTDMVAKVDTIKRMMHQAGVSDTDIKGAGDMAWQMSQRYRNLSVADVMELQNDMRAIMGSQARATEHADIYSGVASYISAYEASHPGRHGASHEQIMRETNAAIKSAEIAVRQGDMMPEEMKQHVTNLMKIRTLTGGQVTMADYLAAQRAAGVSYLTMSPEMRFATFGAFVQEFGRQAGVRSMTGFNKIVGNVMNRSYSLRQMEALGLLISTPEHPLEHSKSGMPKINTGEIVGAKLAAENRLAWATQVLLPAIAGKLGFKPEELQTEQGREKLIKTVQELVKAFPDRNSAADLIELIRQEPRLAKVANLFNEMQGDFKEFKTWSEAKQELAKGWENFWIAVTGENFTPWMSGNVRQVSDALNDLAAHFKQTHTWRENLNAIWDATKKFGGSFGGAGWVGIGAGGLLGLRALNFIMMGLPGKILMVTRRLALLFLQLSAGAAGAAGIRMLANAFTGLGAAAGVLWRLIAALRILNPLLAPLALIQGARGIADLVRNPEELKREQNPAYLESKRELARAAYEVERIRMLREHGVFGPTDDRHDRDSYGPLERMRQSMLDQRIDIRTAEGAPIKVQVEVHGRLDAVQGQGQGSGQVPLAVTHTRGQAMPSSGGLAARSWH